MSPRNQHWFLGCLAVVHSAVILAFMLARPWPIPPPWFDPLWVGFATLWFFCPLVLLLHVGRSLLRVAIPLIVAGVIAIPWWRFYRVEAAPAFGLPAGCTLSPISMTRFFAAYVDGRADARRDIRDGRLAVEVYGFGAGGYIKPLRERFGVEARVVADCLVDEHIMGHAYGYNKISASQLARKSGEHILDPSTGQPKGEFLADGTSHK